MSSRWKAISPSQFPWEQDALDFILAKYSLNGTFLGFERLAHQLEFCGVVSGELHTLSRTFVPGIAE